MDKARYEVIVEVEELGYLDRTAVNVVRYPLW